MTKVEKNRIDTQGAVPRVDRRSAASTTSSAESAANVAAIPNAKQTDRRASSPATPIDPVKKQLIEAVAADPTRYLRIAGSIVGSQDAEEILQQAYMRVINTSVPVDEAKNPTGWFGTIVYNLARDFKRRKTADSLDEMGEERGLDSFEQFGHTPDLASGIEAAEKALKVERAKEAANLSEVQRLLLDMRYGDAELSYEELAELCRQKGFTKQDGSPMDADTIKSRLNQARKRLKPHLEDIRDEAE